jgi:AcrR family transcriptional regulator
MDARVERTRSTVLRAATDLLVDGGPEAVTVDAVVAHSGVAKSTIYRHWQSRDDLLNDVVRCLAPQVDEPDPDLPFDDALRQMVQTVVAAFNDPDWSRVIPAVLMLKLHSEDIAGIDREMHGQQMDVLERVLERGERAGLVRPGWNGQEVAAQLFGPLLFAHVGGDVVIDEGFGDRVVERFLASERLHTAQS